MNGSSKEPLQLSPITEQTLRIEIQKITARSILLLSRAYQVSSPQTELEGLERTGV
jgi:hypothetical protein